MDDGRYSADIVHCAYRPHVLKKGNEDSQVAPVDEHAIVEFTTGACGYLAVALHDMTGWPVRAEYEHPPWDSDIAHIWVVNDDGFAVDINGVHGTSWAKTRYSSSVPGPISSIGREEALGKCDEDFQAWARELIADNPDHFGNPQRLYALTK